MCQTAFPLLLFLLLLLPLTRLHPLLHLQLLLLYSILLVLLSLLRLVDLLLALLYYVLQRVAELFVLLFASDCNHCHLWRGVL